MNLTEYSSSLPIFIDANIFLDYALPNAKFGDVISDFLEKIELQLISAITTPLVLNEVSYILLLQRGMATLKTDNRDIVRSKIKESFDLVHNNMDLNSSVNIFNQSNPYSS